LSKEEAEIKADEVFSKIYKLDQPDTLGYWRDFDKQLAKKSKILSEAGFQKLHISGKDTDIIIGLNPGHLFIGGASYMEDSRRIFTNLPTEEIYTSPDYRLTEGKISFSKATKLFGKTVNDFWLEFSKGKVVKYGAKQGADVLKKLIDYDQRSAYLGEVALVDCASEIGKSGLFFDNGLFDENAACHVALGNSYSETLPGAIDLSDEERLKKGLNISAQHEDLMFGNETTTIVGIKTSGERCLIMENGHFK
jgi:aminopeptidase